MIWIVLGAVKGAVIAVILFSYLMDGIDDDVQLLFIILLGAIIGATWQFWFDALLSILIIVAVIGSIVITFLMLDSIKDKLRL